MHGYPNVDVFAESLPQGANILDVGSGDSEFGKTVAELRPDVSWTNFDFSYRDEDALAKISEGAPDNIKYVAGDVTKLGEMYEPGTFDAVYSYWMMPHLSIDDVEPALEAAKAMFDVAKPGATISVGPVPGDGLFSSVRYGKAHRVTKDGSLDADGFAQMIASKTKLPRLARFTQKTANEVVTPTLGTSRWSTHEGPIPMVYDPKTGRYVSPFSSRGVGVASELVVAAARYMNAEYPEGVAKAKKVAIVGAAAVGTGVAMHKARKHKKTRQ